MTMNSLEIITPYGGDRDLNGGGVMLAMNNNIIIVKVLGTQVVPGECVAITLQIYSKIVINIVVFYRPPAEYVLDKFVNMMIDLSSEKCNLIFLGDFNLPLILIGPLTQKTQ